MEGERGRFLRTRRVCRQKTSSSLRTPGIRTTVDPPDLPYTLLLLLLPFHVVPVYFSSFPIFSLKLSHLMTNKH